MVNIVIQRYGITKVFKAGDGGVEYFLPIRVNKFVREDGRGYVAIVDDDVDLVMVVKRDVTYYIYVVVFEYIPIHAVYSADTGILVGDGFKKHGDKYVYEDGYLKVVVGP